LIGKIDYILEIPNSTVYPSFWFLRKKEMPANKNPQLFLFEDLNPKSEIVKISARVLNKDQIKFNKLVEDIKRASNELELLKEELPKTHAELLTISKPLEEEMLKVDYKLIEACHHYLNEMKLSKSQKTTVSDYILFKIRDLPSDPPKEIKDIYDLYSEVCYEDEMKIQKDFANEHMSQMVEDMFGFKVDMDFDPNLSEMENAQRLKAKLEEKGFKLDPFSYFQGEPQPERKKSKKQLQAEENRRLQQEKEESLRKKSFKAIYMDLMKAFHPDTETDPKQKAEKEEISKQITVAYSNQDFFGLLKLEAEYLSQHENRIQTLPKDQLQYYMKMLGNQKAELKEQKDELKQKYAAVYNGIYVMRMSRKDFLKKYKRDFELQIQQELGKISLLKNRDMAQRKMIVEGMEEELDEMEDFDFFDF
jgi:hypothetical protein